MFKSLPNNSLQNLPILAKAAIATFLRAFHASCLLIRLFFASLAFCLSFLIFSALFFLLSFYKSIEVVGTDHRRFSYLRNDFNTIVTGKKSYKVTVFTCFSFSVRVSISIKPRLSALLLRPSIPSLRCLEADATANDNCSSFLIYLNVSREENSNF